jgi:small subunit ribosomal protein S17
MAEEEKTENGEQTEEPEAEADEQAPEAEAPAEETPAEEAPADEAPAEEAPEAEDAPAEESTEDSADEAAPPAEADASTEDAAEGTDPDTPGREAEDVSGDDDLDWKTRRRLQRSRGPSEARPQRNPEERQTERGQRRGENAVSRRRHRQTRRAKKGEPGTGTPPAERRPNPAKVRQGIVVSDRSDKTITVRIDIARRHPAYEKIVRRSRTLRAHDEQNEAGQGDVVRVVETRPISRSKRWRLLEVVEKAR